MTRKKRVSTINDVAKIAGISIGTVSRYLNGFKVKEANRMSIEAAIADLSYSPNAFASAMKSEDTRMVGLLVPDYDEFHAQLLGNLAKTLRTVGLVTLTYCHESNDTDAKEALRFFRTHRVRAVITCGLSAMHDDILEMIKGDVQVITYDNVEDELGADRVIVNNREASCLGVCELLKQGHERVGIATGVMDHWTSQQRLLGWRDAFAMHGIKVPEDLIIGGEWSRAGGYAAMKSFWESANKPTAFFGANHQMTLGALTYCQRNNISVPNDLSILSFDDIEMFEFLTPSVAAISQPVMQIAETIKTMLADRLDNPTTASRRLEVLKCGLHFRQSIGPVPTREQ